MKQYSFLSESIGRNLVGASRFSSRKSVAQTIMQQYPQPQMLANKLQQMAEASYGKEKETLLNLSLECRGMDMNTYPAFAAKISGFSGIWKYIGIGVASAAATAGAKYMINKANEYGNQNPNSTVTDKTKYALGAANKDIRNTYNRANNYVRQTYKNWKTPSIQTTPSISKNQTIVVR